MCAGQAADLPTTAPAETATPPKRGGCPGGGKRTKKVNTIVLELVCLVTEQGQQQIFSFQAGQAGGSSKNQISSSKYEPVCTCLYPPKTLMYSDIQVCTCMYRHVPCCTSLYRHVPRIPVLVCTGMYEYVPGRTMLMYVFACIRMYQYIKRHTDLYRLVLVCTSMYFQ